MNVRDENVPLFYSSFCARIFIYFGHDCSGCYLRVFYLLLILIHVFEFHDHQANLRVSKACYTQLFPLLVPFLFSIYNLFFVLFESEVLFSYMYTFSGWSLLYGLFIFLVYTTIFFSLFYLFPMIFSMLCIIFCKTSLQLYTFSIIHFSFLLDCYMLYGFLQCFFFSYFFSYCPLTL